MDLEKIIIQTLIEYQFGDNLKNGDYVTGVKKMYFGEVAAMVVKKYNDIHNVVNRRELLLAFYQHLVENNPFSINSFSKEREVDRFLKANNNG